MRTERKKTAEESLAVIPARIKPPELPEIGDDQKIGTYFFEGGWRPDLDASEIGPDNFSVLENMRYSEDGPVGVAGYTKRTSTTTAFVVPTTAPPTTAAPTTAAPTTAPP